jgi:nucleotide-binding universal stress UspA family protein
MAELKATGDELLVAIDFSPCSLRALDAALEWRRGGTELTLLHVLDRVVIDQITWIGLGTADDVLARMRTRAENELARLVSARAAAGVETMVVVGEPFVEIVKIANDLECDVIFIGIHGREAGLKQLLFGGTAEKVLRGANRPVLCVP